MDGFTASIYAIVINVVIPAVISVFTFVLFFLSLKIFSNISITSGYLPSSYSAINGRFL